MLDNDSDPDNDALTITFANTPASGGSAIPDVNGTILYTPGLNFVGTDTFSYVISDGHMGQASATVTVVVTSVSPPHCSVLE